MCRKSKDCFLKLHSIHAINQIINLAVVKDRIPQNVRGKHLYVKGSKHCTCYNEI